MKENEREKNGFSSESNAAGNLREKERAL